MNMEQTGRADGHSPTPGDSIQRRTQPHRRGDCEHTGAWRRLTRSGQQSAPLAARPRDSSHEHNTQTSVVIIHALGMREF